MIMEGEGEPMNENKHVEAQTVPVQEHEEGEKAVVPDESALADADGAKRMVAGVFFVLILLGVTTGYILSRLSTNSVAANQKPGWVKTGKVAGITDTKTFKDSAVGVIQKGGLDKEGTHQLVRDGGPSQTVYLISSAVDLNEFAGKKVKVWGQTMGAQKAAWLMDVGKVEVQ